MKFTYQPEAKPLEGYTIKRAINRGGFGEVYFALTDSGKEVALKLIHDHSEVELRGVSQCLNIKHPNLIMIFDIRKDVDEDCWVVMEFVHGKTLSEILAKNQTGLPMEDVLRWVEGISSGIGFLHDHGIVHRDLKPANVFMEHNHVKIGDIGLSKFITPSKRSAQTQSVGTVYYMAPEVAHGRYDKEVDVYALGVMTYELLTGKLPFDGQSAGEIMMKHLTAMPDMSPIPEALRPSILRALEKDPTKRYHDIREYHQEFRQAVLGRKREASVYPEQSTTRLLDTSPYPSQNLEQETKNSGRRNLKGHFQFQRYSTATIALGLILVMIALYSIRWTTSIPLFGIPRSTIYSMPWYGYGLLGLAGYCFYLAFSQRKNHLNAYAQTKIENPLPTSHQAQIYPRKNFREMWDQQWLSLCLQSNFRLSLFSLVIVGGGFLIAPEMFGMNREDWDFMSPNMASLLAICCLSGWGLMFINAYQLRYRSWGKYDDWMYPVWGIVVAKCAELMSNLLMQHHPLGGEMWGGSVLINTIGPFTLSQGNQPTTLAYVLYFGSLFYVVGWLKMTTPYRQKKVSFGKLLEAGIWGYILALVFYNNTSAVFFPMILALILQLSSTWFNQEQPTPGGHS